MLLKRGKAPARTSLSQSQLIWRKFRKHRIASVGLVVLAGFFLIALFCDFLAPNDPAARYGVANMPPTKIRVYCEDEGLQRPFVYGYMRERDPITLELRYSEDRSVKYPVSFFVRGYEYRLLGLIPTNIHLFGVAEPGGLFLFGTDGLGRDIFSRTIVATRISSSIGLISIMISLVLGLLIGGLSAWFGGYFDLAVQKVIEVLICVPEISLWMGLTAALPRDWSPLRVYFCILVILALRNWINVARVVRGKFISLKNEDFVLAALAMGGSSWWVITRHLIPNFISYVIVSVTVSIPAVILGETALSFLGIGLRPPIISWGVLLQGAQNIASIAAYPWRFIPALFVITLVLAFNFVGDGLRDAADPYK
jgi:peptide/nickel transport system permease protein